MNQNNVEIAETYYQSLEERNFKEMEKILHPDVQFIAPLAKIVGREGVIEAAKQFRAFIKNLKVRVKCGTGNQVMIVYDVEFPAPIGHFPTAALLTLQNGLIAKMELFYDPRPLERK